MEADVVVSTVVNNTDWQTTFDHHITGKESAAAPSPLNP